MNTILQKRIEEAVNKICCTDCPFASIRNCKECVEKENAIKTTTFALQNQWISIEEALPTERDEEDEQYSTNVFARTKDCIRYAYYDFYNESWCSVEGGYRFGGDVTHWMPVPSMKGGEEWQ